MADIDADIISFNNMDKELVHGLLKRARLAPKKADLRRDKRSIEQLVELMMPLSDRFLSISSNDIYDKNDPLGDTIPNLQVSIIKDLEGQKKVLVNPDVKYGRTIGVFEMQTGMLPGIAVAFPTYIDYKMSGYRFDEASGFKKETLTFSKTDKNHADAVMHFEAYVRNLGMLVYDRGIVVKILDADKPTKLGAPVESSVNEMIKEYCEPGRKDKELVREGLSLIYNNPDNSIYLGLGINEGNVWSANTVSLPRDMFHIVNEDDVRALGLWLPNTKEVFEQVKEMAKTGPLAGYGPVFSKMPISSSLDDPLTVYLFRL
ncbi:MAG: hypothetical protein NDI94_05835 [Candidatus Woesearchaeota archaeon]|nr:hypothetical protein [Candidatus Woesearchaeota archaeon]